MTKNNYNDDQMEFITAYSAVLVRPSVVNFLQQLFQLLSVDPHPTPHYPYSNNPNALSTDNYNIKALIQFPVNSVTMLFKYRRFIYYKFLQISVRQSCKHLI